MSLLTWQRGSALRVPLAGERPLELAIPTAAARRADLDWIRVAAFGLLILYHSALVYAPFDWHIHSAYTYAWVREALLITQPWRLTLLFLVSGAALRFASRGKAPAALLKGRAVRLGLPLAFGVAVLVPVQAWIEAVDKGSWSGGLFAWIAREFSPAGLADGVPVNHLWFVVYIAAYTLAAIPLLSRPRAVAAMEDGLAWALRGWGLLVLPAAYLILARCWLYYYFGQTNALLGDWYGHAQSLAAFLFGFLLARREDIWRDFERLRWPALGLVAVALPLAMVQSAHPGGGAFHEIPRSSVYALDQWAAIVAILGFGGRHLRGAGGPRLRYLNDAVFPCYLAHQTVLVLAVWLIRPARLPAPLEALTLVAVTFGGSLAIYETVRRCPPLRPFWGLRAAKPA